MRPSVSGSISVFAVLGDDVAGRPVDVDVDAGDAFHTGGLFGDAEVLLGRLLNGRLDPAEDHVLGDFFLLGHGVDEFEQILTHFAFRNGHSNTLR